MQVKCSCTLSENGRSTGKRPLEPVPLGGALAVTL
jgi:hypothetical protein